MHFISGLEVSEAKYTKPMPCQFPFIYKGEKYEECTNTTLPKEYDGLEEDLLWCATHIDNDRNMVLWGQCDMEKKKTCQNSAKVVSSVTFGSVVLFVFTQLFLLNNA